jgi:ferrochelatase
LNKKKGLLFINLGTPKSPADKDVYIYLKEFLLDKYVIDYPWLLRQILVRGLIIPLRYKKSAATYRVIWDKERGSPLKYNSQAITDKVGKLLESTHTVSLAMRYQEPSIESELKKMLAQNVSEIIIFPMYPQFAASSTATVFDKVDSVLKKLNNTIPVNKIAHFYNHPGYINALAEKINNKNWDSYDHILFSYHGLPERHLTKDDISGCHCMKKENCCEAITKTNELCYRAHCFQTTKSVVEILQIPQEKYSISFQSRLGREKWLEPYTHEVLKEFPSKGKKKILVVCPAFISDCLETLYEIEIEYAEEFRNHGGEILDKVECVNYSDTWAKGIIEILATH